MDIGESPGFESQACFNELKVMVVEAITLRHLELTLRRNRIGKGSWVRIPSVFQ